MSKKAGISLFEVLLAIFILILALIPIFSNINTQAAITLETEKIQMADKILQSIKEELNAMLFKDLVERSKTAQKNEIGQFIFTDDLYPVTLRKVLEIQKKYKDFEVDGFWFFINRGIPNDTSMIQVEARVKWTIPGKQMERKRSIVLVSQK
ncbi:MAG: hypothetical protein HQM08_15550 [Candidatus Riflebacteria bacterium]|nr:hypothetical protein [Candidatus Riflebacteria bacterium]